MPRFIELMPIAAGAALGAQALVTVPEMRLRLAPLLGAAQAERDADRGPARYVASRTDPSLRIGFIGGTSDTFCNGCDRLRVASDGTLRPCLATRDGVDVRRIAEMGNVDGVAAAVARAWQHKPDGSQWRGCTEPSAAHISMREIGG